MGIAQPESGTGLVTTFVSTKGAEAPSPVTCCYITGFCIYLVVNSGLSFPDLCC